MKDPKFVQHTWVGMDIAPDSKIDNDLVFRIDATRMIIPEPKYSAPRVGHTNRQSLLSKLKKRISHAWYALKGGECD